MTKNCFICEKNIQPSKIYGQVTVKGNKKKREDDKVYQYCGHHSGVELKNSLLSLEKI